MQQRHRGVEMEMIEDVRKAMINSYARNGYTLSQADEHRKRPYRRPPKEVFEAYQAEEHKAVTEQAALAVLGVVKCPVDPIQLLREVWGLESEEEIRGRAQKEYGEQAEELRAYLKMQL